MKPTFAAHDLTFEEMISEAAIQERVREMGAQLRAVYQDKNPLFLCVLNGAFIFAADLVRAFEQPCEMDFVRLASYDGLASTGKVRMTMDTKNEVQGRHVIIVEDIVDTGTTLAAFREELQRFAPASVAIATLLMKPEALRHELEVAYVGFDIPNKFVIGCGLDYNEQGRHLRGIYQLKEKEK